MENLTLQEIWGVLPEVLLVVIPLWLTLILRSYVQGVRAEKRLTAVTQLANTAIDYVENLERRGELTVPPNMLKGHHKVVVAGGWLKTELNRMGMYISTDKAQEWAAAAFQQRPGSGYRLESVRAEARQAISWLQHCKISSGFSESEKIELAADWLVVQLANEGTTVSRQEALAWIRAELLNQLSGQAAMELPSPERLAYLAEQAVNFVNELKTADAITIKTDAGGNHVESEIATAWLIVEAVKQRLPVTPHELIEAVTIRLEEGK